jgi:phosphatidylserine/phosphatidylglycerophosphate/cardiolipin synthase-like enzyme
MDKMRYGVLAAKVRLVADGAYPAELKSLIARSTRRCLCSLFIIDLSPARDRGLLVSAVMHDLQSAAWRGVDVRVLIGGCRTNVEMAELADAARARAHQLGVPCRWLTSKRNQGSHMKTVIADDRVLTGSHNWSAGAFTNQTQDSILVESQSLAAYLVTIFEDQWARAGERTGDVPI